MRDGIPTYIKKLQRAKQLNFDIAKAIHDFSVSRPYEAFLNEANEWRWRFTKEPPHQIETQISEFINCMSSSLDHLMVSLVPTSRSRKTSFPLYFRGIWEASGTEEVDKQRKRWDGQVDGVSEGALEILKNLQPTKDDLEDPNKIHHLISLRNMWNIDKHRGESLKNFGLVNVRRRFRLSENQTFEESDPSPVLLGEGAIVWKPSDSRKIELLDISGTVQLHIRVTQPDGFAELTSHFQGISEYVETQVIEPLKVFSREVNPL